MKIRDPDDFDSIMTTVNVYKSGKVMVQWYLKPFQDSFQAFKYLLVRENTSPLHAVETDPPTVSSIPAEEEHHDTGWTLTLKRWKTQ